MAETVAYVKKKDFYEKPFALAMTFTIPNQTIKFGYNAKNKTISYSPSYQESAKLAHVFYLNKFSIKPPFELASLYALADYLSGSPDEPSKMKSAPEASRDDIAKQRLKNAVESINNSSFSKVLNPFGVEIKKGGENIPSFQEENSIIIQMKQFEFEFLTNCNGLKSVETEIDGKKVYSFTVSNKDIINAALKASATNLACILNDKSISPGDIKPFWKTVFPELRVFLNIKEPK